MEAKNPQISPVFFATIYRAIKKIIINICLRENILWKQMEAKNPQISPVNIAINTIKAEEAIGNINKLAP